MGKHYNKQTPLLHNLYNIYGAQGLSMQASLGFLLYVQLTLDKYSVNKV